MITFLVHFIIFCVAAYLFVTFVIPLVLFVLAAVVIGVANILDYIANSRRRR